MRSASAHVLGVVFCLLVGLAPGAARAAGAGPVILAVLPAKAQVTDADKEEARREYAAVESAWAERELDAALRHADAAFRAVPNASTAILRAAILDAQDRPCDALAALLLASDLDPTRDERAAIAAQAPKHGAACTPAMAWATVTTEPPGADVVLDGVSFRAPRTVALSLGAHAVHIVAPGHEPLDASLTAWAVGPVEATFRLAPEPVLTRDPEPRAPAPAPLVVEPVVTATAPPPDDGPRLLPWFLIGGGVAALGAGVGMHVWAMDAADQTSKYAQPVDGLSDEDRKDRFDQANDDMTLRGTLAYVFYGVGGAAVVAGTVLVFVDPWADDPGPVSVRPLLSPGLSGLAVEGSF